jgi:hypothetical protein
MASSPAPPPRRAVLALALSGAVAGLTGCGADRGSLRVQPLGGDPAPPSPTADADELARRDAVAAALALRRSALAATAPADHPDAAALLTAVAAAAREQLEQLGEAQPPATGAGTSTAPPATPTATPEDGVAGDQLPGALAAAAARARAALPGVSGGMARLLACLAAGDAVAAAAVAAALGQPAPGATPSAPSSPTATPTPTPTATPTATPAPGAGGGALSAALAGEEAAVYGYGVVAVRLTGDQRTAALDALGAHTRTVDDLRSRVDGPSASGSPAPPAWTLPSPVHDAPSALALAVRLEEACTAGAADLVAAVDAADRAWAADLVADRATRAAAWRSATGDARLVALPGLTGR